MLAACTFRPDIISASVRSTSATDATVYVRLKREVASVIKKRQLYFGIIVVNCGTDTDRYPIEPYIGGKNAAEFEFPLPTSVVEVTGNIPLKILREYQRPCIFLEGGGYFTGKMRSASVPLIASPADVPKT
jgi:hypothetical protein